MGPIELNINQLPNEILLNTLKRAGFSCASVCKQWHRITQDPHFQEYAKSNLNKTVEVTHKKHDTVTKINITVNGNDNLQTVKNKIVVSLNILPETIVLNTTNITDIFKTGKVEAQHTVRRQLFI